MPFFNREWNPQNYETLDHAVDVYNSIAAPGANMSIFAAFQLGRLLLLNDSTGNWDGYTEYSVVLLPTNDAIDYSSDAIQEIEVVPLNSLTINWMSAERFVSVLEGHAAEDPDTEPVTIQIHVH